MHTVPILIPAYQPSQTLIDLVRELHASTANPIIVINDGSDPQCDAIFNRLDGVELLHHALNLGKGAALKTGLNYALAHYPDSPGVVTADADGQHLPQDILRVAKSVEAHPGALVMGVRGFAGEVPLRSRIGNDLTRVLTHVLIGQRLADTQTGLRGIPADLIPHLLRLQSSGYEFELDMLIACKHQGCPVLQEPIQTVYLQGNKSSHFHPIFDSMRIYFLLLRFSILSVLTAVVDNVIFVSAFQASGSLGQSQLAGRLVAMVFNYAAARKMVFHSRQRHAIVLPKYVSLVAINGLVAYALIRLLHARLGIGTIPAKLFVEGCLFIVNFAIQRDFVFTRRKQPAPAKDCPSYYTSVAPDR